MKWRVLVGVALVVVAVAAAQEAEELEPEQMPDSECWTCHKAGGKGSGPVPEQIYNVTLGDGLVLEPGVASELTLQITNAWGAELSELEIRLDISGAPSLGFGPRPPPILDERLAGELADPTADGIGGLLDERRADRVSFEAPLGATALRIDMRPTNTGSSGPALDWSIWVPNSDRGGDPDVTLAAPAGQAIHWQATGAVAQGLYTIEAAQDGWSASPLDMSRLDPQRFEVAWSAWFNVSESDPVRTVAPDQEIGPMPRGIHAQHVTPDMLELRWPIALLDPLVHNETIAVRIEGTVTHEHIPQVRTVDRARIWEAYEFVIAPPADPDSNESAPVVVIEPPPPGPETTLETAEPAGPDIVDVAEILGYVTALLIVSSIITGGAFGHWTARIQDWVLRRRRRRIAFHTVTGTGLLLAAAAHVALFIVEDTYAWPVGLLLGGFAVVGLLLLAWTGIRQRRMIAWLGHEGWRWLHLLLAVVTVAAAALHILLDGIHFVDVQSEVGWQDPLLDALLPEEPSVAPAPAQN